MSQNSLLFHCIQNKIYFTPELKELGKLIDDNVVEMFKYKNCIVMFRRESADTFYSYLVFNNFGKSVISAIKDATSKHKGDNIIVTTYNDRIAKILGMFGYDVIHTHEGEAILLRKADV